MKYLIVVVYLIVTSSCEGSSEKNGRVDLVGENFSKIDTEGFQKDAPMQVEESQKNHADLVVGQAVVKEDVKKDSKNNPVDVHNPIKDDQNREGGGQENNQQGLLDHSLVIKDVQPNVSLEQTANVKKLLTTRIDCVVEELLEKMIAKYDTFLIDRNTSEVLQESIVTLREEMSDLYEKLQTNVEDFDTELEKKYSNAFVLLDDLDELKECIGKTDHENCGINTDLHKRNTTEALLINSLKDGINVALGERRER